MTTAAEFAAQVRARQPVLGYWLGLGAPPATERLARVGYDYVVLDAQHGLLGYRGVLGGLTAVDAAAGAVGLVRVEANEPAAIGHALDAGAAGVIVPLVSSPAEAEAAVRAARYPPDDAVLRADAVRAEDRTRAGGQQRGGGRAGHGRDRSRAGGRVGRRRHARAGRHLRRPQRPPARPRRPHPGRPGAGRRGGTGAGP